MSHESTPQGGENQFEQSIVETIDTGYMGPITKQMGKEKVTLAEMAELLGSKAPSAKMIEELGLLIKESTELEQFARVSELPELSNQTIFLGTKYIDKDGKVYFKTFVPPQPYAGNQNLNRCLYTSADVESKYYGVAMPLE